MAFRSKKASAFLPLFLGIQMCLDFINSSLAEPITTTAVAPAGVKKCYKCEGDCNGGPGTVEECHPDSDSLIFACYTIIVDGKPFQRGCTLDFSDGEDCVKEKGNTYCFCRTDECNNSLASFLSPTSFKETVLFSVIIGFMSSNIFVFFKE